MSKIEPGSLEELQNWVNSRIETQVPFRICGNGSRFVSTISGNQKDIPGDILSLKNSTEHAFLIRMTWSLVWKQE